MSEIIQTSGLEINSVAERLRRAGFRQTGIARAVTELVGEYLGIHANMSTNLIGALGNSKDAVGSVLGAKEAANDPQFRGDAANDPQFEQAKTGTHG